MGGHMVTLHLQPCVGPKGTEEPQPAPGSLYRNPSRGCCWRSTGMGEETDDLQSWGAFTYSSTLRRQSTNIIAQKPWDQQWTQKIETLGLKVAGEKSPLCCCTGWCCSGCWHEYSVQSGRQRDPSLQNAKPAWGRHATCRGWGHPRVLQNGLLYFSWSWFADKGNEKKLRLQQFSCVPLGTFTETKQRKYTNNKRKMFSLWY